MARKRKHPWQCEIDWATAICAPFGCAVEISTAMYEIAKVSGDGISLVIYPHRTTAGHYHARVRDNGSKDKVRCRTVMIALYRGKGLDAAMAQRVEYSCTFSWKGMSLNDIERADLTPPQRPEPGNE